VKIRWNRPWVWLWIGWILLFFAIEIPAVLNDESTDTLSEHVWAIVASGSLGFFLVAGLLAWLAYHFLIEPRLKK
jgi:hypothetical protein